MRVHIQAYCTHKLGSGSADIMSVGEGNVTWWPRVPEQLKLKHKLGGPHSMFYLFFCIFSKKNRKSKIEKSKNRKSKHLAPPPLGSNHIWARPIWVLWSGQGVDRVLSMYSSRWHRVYFVYNVLSCQCEGQVTETGCIFGTKSPNLGKREFWTKIGRRSFSPLMVPYLHAKNQKDPRTSFRDLASLTDWLTDWLTNRPETIGPSLRGSKIVHIIISQHWIHYWIFSCLGNTIFPSFTSILGPKNAY